MTYDEFMSVINSDVERILSENSANIAQSLLQGLPEDEPCISKEQFQIIRNAVNTSIQSSVQIMFDYLDSLQTKTLVIDPKRTPNAYKEITEYEYDRDKEGNVISGYPDGNDHAISALRYAYEPLFNRRGNSA